MIMKSRNKGIEISHWKVSDADDFYGLDRGEDYDIEPASQDERDKEDNQAAE
jgi:hypothetical protein